MRTDPIDFSDDVIDSRDIVDRIAYLEIDEENGDPEELAELATLRALTAECEGINSEWGDGCMLVAARYFVAHIKEETQELHYEIYAEKASKWDQPVGVRVDYDAFPFTFIDWEALAEDAKRHHTAVMVDGRSFWLSDE